MQRASIYDLSLATGRRGSFLAVLALLLACCLAFTVSQDLPRAEGGSVAAAAAAEPVIGTIAGEYETLPGGSAGYQIPLEVPPGTAGMEPKLALAYNSHTGDGLVGQGWSLSGLTVITRCPRTIAVDGVAGGVSYDAGDRFCLDGTRLIAVEDAQGQPLKTRQERAAAYGRDGTVYHTEVESWTRIVSHGTCGSGPCWFGATLKSGATLSLGRSGNSAAPAVGERFESPPLAGSLRVWALDRSVDLNGNYLTVTYNPPDETGQLYARRIDYTGNDTTRDGGPLAPGRSVRFRYMHDRGDTVPTYRGGAGVINAARLEAVETYLGETVIKRFRLDYDQAPSTGKSRLGTLLECDSADSCLLPSTFTWQDNRLGMTSAGSFDTGARATDSIETALDLTGDGRTDFVRLFDRNGQTFFAIWHSEGSTYRHIEPDYSSQLPWAGGRYVNADVSGDGRADLLLPYDSQGYTWVSIWVSDGRKLVRNTPDVRVGAAAEDQLIPLDLDADGRTDLLRAIRNEKDEVTLSVWQSNGVTYRETGSDLRTGLPYGDSQFPTLDLDGDGRNDLALVYRDQGHARAALFTSDSGRLVRRTPDVDLGVWRPDYRALALDANGDANDDLLRVFEDDAEKAAFDLWLSDGITLAPRQVDEALGTRYVETADYPVDLNGDGRSDLLHVYTTADRRLARTWISDGGELTQREVEIDLGAAELAVTDLSVDAAGAGIAGLLHFYRSGSTVRAASWLADGPFPDLLTRIEDGLGGRIDVTYRPLTDAAVYTRGTSGSYPDIDVQGPFYVVARHQVWDGRQDPTASPADTAAAGHLYAWEYRYAGALNNLLGRGWLGFDSVTTINIYTGEISESRYLQRFPFTGQARETVTRCDAGNPIDPRCTADGTVLAAARQSYVCEDPADCTGEAAAWYQPYPGVYQVLARTVASEQYTYGTYDFTLSRELLGYDDYGNPTAVRIIRNPALPAENLTQCSWYRNDPGRWVLGLTTDQLITGPVECPSAPGWSDDAYTWERLTYDPDTLDVRTAGEFDDSRPDGGDFLTEDYTYDAYGNRTGVSVSYYPKQVSDPAALPREVTTYDPTYHTFPASETTPPNQFGETLTATFQVHPGFGVEILSTDPNGNQTKNLVDGFGRIIETQATSAEDGRLTPTERTAWGRDARGIYVRVDQRTSWVEDAWSWQRSYLDGLSRVDRTESVGAEAGKVIVTDTRYDALGLVAAESLPYFAGQEPAGWSTTTYDLYSREVRVVDADGTVTELAYEGDATGETVVSVAALGTESERKIHDAFNRVGDIVRRDFFDKRPDGTWGSPVSIRFDYDPLQRLVRIEDPAAVVNTIGYDSLGRNRWVEVTGREGYSLGRTEYRYDDRGNLWQKSSPASSEAPSARQVLTFTYDDNERVLTQHLSPGDLTYTFVYDRPSAWLSDAVNTKGMMTGAAASDGSFSYGFSFDTEGNPARQRLAIGGPGEALGPRLFDYRYDPMARPYRATFPDGTVQESRYNLDGTLGSIAVQLPGEELRTFVAYDRYDAFQEPGRVQTFDRGGEARTVSDFTYAATDGLLRHHRIRSLGTAGTTLLDNAYRWTGLGQVEAIVDCNFQGTPAGAGCPAVGDHPIDYSQAFQRDSIGRLTHARGLYGAFDYGYGPGGNLILKEGVTYDYVGHQARAGSDGFAATYFPNGNTKTKVAVRPGGAKASWTYGYDAADHLTSATRAGAGTVTFAYDHDGNRLRKTDLDGATTLYYADDYEVYLEPGEAPRETIIVQGPTGRVMTLTSDLATGEEQAGRAGRVGGGRGGRTGFLALLAAGLALLLLLPLLGPSVRPGRGPFPRWVRRVAIPLLALFFLTSCAPPAVAGAAVEEAGAAGAGGPPVEIAFYHHDQVESVELVTDEQGETLSHLVYRPFGTLDREHSIDPSLVEARFQDQIWDPDTDLYYFNARYYDPAVGRFLTADSIAGVDQLFPSVYDRYAFGDNDPVDYIDPSGHLAFLVAVAIGAVVGAVVSGATYGISTAVSGEEFSWASFGIAVGTGALGGAIGGAFGGSVLVGGVVGGAVASGSEQIVTNLINGEKWNNNLGEALLTGALVGGLTAGALKGGSAGVRGALSRGGRGAKAKAPSSRGRKPMCSSSFPEGTEVATFGGSRDVTEIVEGEHVWGVDPGQLAAPEAGALDPQPFPVTLAIERNAGTLVTLRAGGEEITTTPEHPLWVDGKGWTRAGEVVPGDRLADGFGDRFTVEEVRRSHGLFRVFNFTVDEAENYFVGDHAFLVHNPKCKIKKGGAYSHMQINPGEEIDHIPAKATYLSLNPRTIRGEKISTYRGPAVRMTRTDHLRTTSWGSSRAAKRLRARHSQLIRNGKFAQALQEDVQERVRKFGGKYNPGLRAAVRYAHDAGYITKAERDRTLRVIR